jgi:hypothetical protein
MEKKLKMSNVIFIRKKWCYSSSQHKSESGHGCSFKVLILCINNRLCEMTNDPKKIIYLFI